MMVKLFDLFFNLDKKELILLVGPQTSGMIRDCTKKAYKAHLHCGDIRTLKGSRYLVLKLQRLRSFFLCARLFSEAY